VDIFSLGITLAELSLPVKTTHSGAWLKGNNFWNKLQEQHSGTTIGDKFLDLIKCMVEKDPTKRITSEAALCSHKFLTSD